MVFVVLSASGLALWLTARLWVTRRLEALRPALPAAYLEAVWDTASPDDPPRLIPLAIDLSRKERCTLAFDKLSPGEQRLALHAYGVERLPRWMVAIAQTRLCGPERAIIQQLRHIKASRPQHRPVHFGAIKAQLRLRAASKP